VGAVEPLNHHRLAPLAALSQNPAQIQAVGTEMSTAIPVNPEEKTKVVTNEPPAKLSG